MNKKLDVTMVKICLELQNQLTRLSYFIVKRHDSLLPLRGKLFESRLRFYRHRRRPSGRTRAQSASCCRRRDP